MGRGRKINIAWKVGRAQAFAKARSSGTDIRTIAAAYGVSQHTVTREIRWLEEKGWQMVSKKQLEAIRRYQESNTVQYVIKLSCKYDADIIEKLERMKNKQGYIKSLVRRDLCNQVDTSIDNDRHYGAQNYCHVSVRLNVKYDVDVITRFRDVIAAEKITLTGYIKHLVRQDLAQQ